MDPFRALVLREDGGQVSAAVERLTALPEPEDGRVTVRVMYSSLNYKDALAVCDAGKIIRGDYPFVPGIDLVGEVMQDAANGLERGAIVVGTGWGIGEEHWGGYSETARLRPEWLVPLPGDMSPRCAMGIGTAGFTAMLAVMAIEEGGVRPEDGEVVVTGASGGVGSFSILLLSRKGYRVVASTGKNAGNYLTGLGADRIIGREVLGEGARRPLDSGVWAAAVDSVGGKTLEALISQTRRHGVVAACGLAGGAELDTTVFPFILRGVRLQGIDSNTCPRDLRIAAWTHLSQHISTDTIDEITQTIELEDLPEAAKSLLAGKVTGRYVVRVTGQE